MKKLTSNKEVSEMSMYELAHNSCYAKDGNARYRNFENDFDARELTIKLLEKYADIPNEFTCDEDFDEFIIECLKYGTESIEGLIAVFYRNMWGMADLYEKLKEYEAIGTVEKCREAMERQRAKKPVEYEDKYFACPVCGNSLMYKWEKYPNILNDMSNGLPYCLGCGQAIDWSNKDDR